MLKHNMTLVGWWNSGAPTLAIQHHSLIPLLIRYQSLIIDNTIKITGTVLAKWIFFGNIADPAPGIMH